jgi:hypothetical protein
MMAHLAPLRKEARNRRGANRSSSNYLGELSVEAKEEGKEVGLNRPR